jgi:hypothetical protein
VSDKLQVDRSVGPLTLTLTQRQDEYPVQVRRWEQSLIACSGASFSFLGYPTNIRMLTKGENIGSDRETVKSRSALTSGGIARPELLVPSQTSSNEILRFVSHFRDLDRGDRGDGS